MVGEKSVSLLMTVTLTKDELLRLLTESKEGEVHLATRRRRVAKRVAHFTHVGTEERARILNLASQGFDIPEIAKAMGRAFNTVKRVVQNGEVKKKKN